MAGCKAFATTAGFESVCEALYLQKPVLMVPVHIEQECNAFDATRAGAGIRSDRFDPGNPAFLSAFLSSESRFPLLDTIGRDTDLCNTPKIQKQLPEKSPLLRPLHR